MAQRSKQGKRSRSRSHSRGPRNQKDGKLDLFEILYCRDDDEMNDSVCLGRQYLRNPKFKTFTCNNHFSWKLGILMLIGFITFLANWLTEL